MTMARFANRRPSSGTLHSGSMIARTRCCQLDARIGASIRRRVPARHARTVRGRSSSKTASTTIFQPDGIRCRAAVKAQAHGLLCLTIRCTGRTGEMVQKGEDACIVAARVAPFRQNACESAPPQLVGVTRPVSNHDNPPAFACVTGAVRPGGRGSVRKARSGPGRSGARAPVPAGPGR